MQAYKRRYGTKFQDQIMMEDDDALTDLPTDLTDAAVLLRRSGNDLWRVVSCGGRLLEILWPRALTLARHPLPDDPSYSEFMHVTAAKQERLRDEQYRQLLSSTRRRGFVHAVRPDGGTPDLHARTAASPPNIKL